MKHVIEETKRHINKVLPRTQKVNIRVQKDELGNFVSKIDVFSQGRVFHASKMAGSYHESVNKSYKAILHQIEKLKTKRVSQKLSIKKMEEFAETA